MPYVSLCVDRSHIPYKPNSGEDKQAFMNYKQWNSLLCMDYVNSLLLFVDMDVAYQGRMHGKTCTNYSHFWTKLHEDPDPWLGLNGIILADSAWGNESAFVMTSYSATASITEDKNGSFLFIA